LLGLARQAPSLGDKIRVFIKHPGWRPAGTSLTKAAPPRLEIPVRTKLYVAAQTALTLALASWVLWFRAQHSWLFLTAGATAVMVSLAAIGRQLDGRALE